MANMNIEQIKTRLAKYQNRQKRYKGYPGSPGDDAIFGDLGFYNVGAERAFIHKMVKRYSRVLEYMIRNNRLTISEEELFVLFW